VSVHKKGTRWYVVTAEPKGEDGKRRQKWHTPSHRTKKEAQRAEREILSQRDAGSYVEPTRQTLGAYLTGEWLPAIRATVRPSTWTSYETLVRLHVAPHLGPVPLRQVTPAGLNGLYATLAESGRRDGSGGLSPRTVRYVHTILRRAFGDAVRWGLLARNPVALADPPRQARVEMQAWTAEQAAAFLAAIAAERLYPAFHLALLTGMRRGEILGLRWADVDLDAGRLAVRQTRVDVGYEVVVSEPKTARSRRQVALDGGTGAVLRSWRATQAAERLAWGPGWEDNGLVFTREDGTPVHPQTLTRTFDELVRRSGLPRIRFHGCRHTWATCALAAGVPLWDVSDALGHSSIAITSDIYRHAIPGRAEQAAARVAGLLFGDSSNRLLTDRASDGGSARHSGPGVEAN
jgi:integrase